MDRETHDNKRKDRFVPTDKPHEPQYMRGETVVKTGKHLVLLKKNYGLNKEGEVCALEPEIAALHVSKGFAQYMKPAPEKAPEAKK